MQKLTINIEKYTELKNTYIAHFDGAFDGSIKEPLAELEALIQNNTERCDFILDFKDLIYLNSYAIGQMITWHNLLEKSKGRIFIANSNKEVDEIFNILGIFNLFEFASSVEEAVEALQSGEKA